MSASPAPAPDHIEEELSLPLFFATIAGSAAVLVGLLWLAAPKSVWLAQVETTAGKFIIAFLVVHLLACFVEYFFHRYILHKPVIPFLSKLYRQHTLHHNLTRIGRKRTATGREMPVVENIFPMTTPEQGEASFFPWFTLLAFGLVVSPILAILQWLMPTIPWFFGGYAAMTFSMVLYEVFHAIEHWPFEKWAVLIETKYFGAFWRKVYSFHLRHHAVIDCNEAISGFFTLPIADLCFNTWIFPKSLYTDGGEWEASEFVSPKPVKLIRWMDQASDEIVRNRRLAAQGAPEQPLLAPTPAPAPTKLERLTHGLTHGIGLGVSVASLVLLVMFATLRGDAWHVATFTVFGVTLVLLYVAFAIYYRREEVEWKLAVRKYAHAAIFLVIAGTATPFLLISMRGPWGWSLFGIIWGLCTVGVALQLMFSGRYRVATVAAYILVGMLAVVAVKPVVAHMSTGALWLVLAGVLSYTAGIAFYFWRLPKFAYVPRQLFFQAGSVCHLLAALIFLLPAAA